MGLLTSSGRVRVDAWTWGVRLFKTRSAAAAACRGGHVRVNGERAKPATPVVVGDEVHVRGGERERIVIVTGLLTKRVSAAIAVTCYEDHSPPPPPREIQLGGQFAQRDRGAGRPTKRQRREIDRLRGRQP